MAHTILGPKVSKAAEVVAGTLMNVSAGESVLITADTGTDMAAVDAIQDAAYRRGGKVAVLRLAPAMPFQGTLGDPYIPEFVTAAACASDVWIDMCFPYIAGSKAFDTALHQGRTRYLLAGDMGCEELVRIMAMVDLDEMYGLGDAFADFIATQAGKEGRITCPNGTDMKFVVAPTEGLAMTKGHKAGGYFTPGTVIIIPELESVRGQFVTKFFFHEYYTQSEAPLTMTLDGKVKDVIGGGPENKVMRRSLERAGNGDFGYVVHLTCGIHPAARQTGHCFIEDQRVVGSNAIGLGLPPWQEGGGENHPDCVINTQTITIDGKTIVKDGVIVGPDSLAKMSAKLKPIFG